MVQAVRASFQLLVASSMLLIIFSWGYLTQSARLRELAAKQAALEEMVYNARIAQGPGTAASLPRASRSVVRSGADSDRGTNRVARFTPPVQRLVGVWSRLNTTNAPPHFPDTFPDTERAQCLDPICSNFLSTDTQVLHCAKYISKKLPLNISVTPTCRFQNGASKPVYLLRSYPGSGNTWARQVLEKATGICTGSIYCDSELWESGMIGEGINTSSVLTVKTHTGKTHGDATIFIIRNPISAIVSFWKWYLIYRNIYIQEKGSHVVNPPIQYFRNNSQWNRGVVGQMKIWLNILKHQLSLVEQPLLIVAYEDMKHNMTREVFRMLDFMKVSYSPEEVQKRLMTDTTAFKRPTQEFDPYTPEQRELVRSQLRDLLESLHDDKLVTLIEFYLSKI